MNISGLHSHSFGYVVDDIKDGTHYIYVYPIEEIPNIDGDMITPEPSKVDNKTNDDGDESIIINRDIKLRAKWLPFGNYNRLTAPSVCRGEMVLLFKYGNSENLFWIPLYTELNLRKKERVIYVYSNKRKIEDEFNIDNYYYISIDTVDKIIRLHTSKNDGEVTTYDIEINGKDGTLIITDGKDNEIVLNSVDDKLHLTTNKEVVINTKNYTLNTEEMVNNVSKNKKESIGDKYDITLKKFSLSNGSDELIDLISKFIETVADIKHIGNLGAPTVVEGTSKKALLDIKNKLDAFK